MNIETLAEAAGFGRHPDGVLHRDEDGLRIDDLARFANLVLEESAKVADQQASNADDGEPEGCACWVHGTAVAIRALKIPEGQA